MFEELEEEQRLEKEERKKTLWITALIVSVLVIVGAIVYITSRGHPKALPAQPPAAVSQTAPDPIRDLKIVQAKMGKDPTGIRVMWSVQLQNKSPVYTYSDIQYEARFMGADGKVRTTTRDIIKDSIAPGEEKKIPQFLDGIYDPNSLTYQFVLISATSAAR
jgi:hypothetical protein